MKNTEYSDNLRDPEKINDQDTETTENESQEKAPAAEIDVVDKLEEDINDICNIYINNLDRPDEIYENNGLFVAMLKYIYKRYLGDVIGNNKDSNYNFRYDYDLLDKLFYIYTSLVYKYKQNKRPSILEYSLFVNMDRNTIYNAAMGFNKSASPETMSKVKKWYTECENQLANGGSVFEIFLLKSQYRYNDNLAPIPIESQGPALAANELPDLSIAKIAKKDDKGRKKKT